MSYPIQALSDLVIGTVEIVSPAEIVVSLGGEAPQAIALNTGIPTPFPRINSYVLLPNEVGATVAYVTWIGVMKSQMPRGGPRELGLLDLPFPTRKMNVSPIGTLLLRNGRDGKPMHELSRGVLAFPSVGDQVLIPTPDQVAAIVGAGDTDRRVVIGSSPLAMDADIMVDPDKIFGRHLAVLGNTGSGKSCSVAGLIRWSIDAAAAERKKADKQGKPNARFIILDPNGEYSRAFADDPASVRVFRVPPLQGDEKPLKVPAWLWNGAEWSTLSHAQPAVQRPLLLQGLRELKSGKQLDITPEAQVARLVSSYCASIRSALANGRREYTGFPGKQNFGGVLVALSVDCAVWPGQIDVAHHDAVGHVQSTVEALIRAKLERGKYWSDFAAADLEELAASLQALLDSLPPGQVDEHMHEDAPLAFDVSSLASHLEGLAARQSANVANFVSTLGLRIRGMLADSRLGSVVNDPDPPEFKDWLDDYVGANNAANGNIAVIDLSLVPSDTVHIIVSVLARIVFEALQRFRRNTGQSLPTVLVLEEAHNFVKGAGTTDRESWNAADLCRDIFERISREGRKFGLGLLVSSQRPSELSPTLLAQCNTFLLHRIVNDADQKLVSKLVPDNIGGLLKELPGLPSGHAILLGWAAPIPVLVEMRELNHDHRPRSDDPAYWDVWTGKEERDVDWSMLAAGWQQ